MIRVNRTVMVGIVLTLTFGAIALPTLALNQSNYSISSSGMIASSSMFGLVGIGLGDVMGNNPTFWQMVNITNAKILRVVTLFESPYPTAQDMLTAANNAQNHGVKLYFILASDGMTVHPATYWIGSITQYHAMIDTVQLENLRNNNGVYGYDICNEPDCYNDTRSGILKDALQYVKSKDPTHIVSVGLAPKFYSTLSGQAYIDATKSYISGFAAYADVIDVHCYDLGGYYNGQLTSDLSSFFDQIVIPAANRKSVIVGEMGCWTDYGTDMGISVSFTEQQQADYFKLYGQVTKPRNITPFVYLLVDDYSTGYPHFGLFTPTAVPKMAALKVYDYLAV